LSGEKTPEVSGGKLILMKGLKKDTGSSPKKMERIIGEIKKRKSVQVPRKKNYFEKTINKGKGRESGGERCSQTGQLKKEKCSKQKGRRGWGPILQRTLGVAKAICGGGG